MKSSLRIGGLCALLSVLSNPVGAQEPSAAERAAALKVNIAASQSVLRQHEWVETTTVLMKGDEKSRQQERCYYGADGKVTKVELNSSPEPEKKRGLRGKVAEKKKGELTDYMKNAVGLVKMYVPPDANRIEAAKQAGNVSIEMLDPGKRARLNFKNYVKQGDNLGVEIDLVNNRPLALKVSTFLEDASDAVTLDVKMSQLLDGTSYPSDTTLDAKAKNLKVAVQNSGYRKMAN